MTWVALSSAAKRAPGLRSTSPNSNSTEFESPAMESAWGSAIANDILSSLVRSEPKPRSRSSPKASLLAPVLANCLASLKLWPGTVEETSTDSNMCSWDATAAPCEASLCTSADWASQPELNASSPTKAAEASSTNRDSSRRTCGAASLSCLTGSGVCASKSSSRSRSRDLIRRFFGLCDVGRVIKKCFATAGAQGHGKTHPPSARNGHAPHFGHQDQPRNLPQRAK